MLELGKYAVPVMSAYALSLLALVLLIAVSWRQAGIAKRNMDAAETRKAERLGR